MGQDGGRKPAGFDLSNSPVQASHADLASRALVQRTSAGTQGVLAARHATRQWCASLVVASATARAVAASGLGTPAYVITGRIPLNHDSDEDEVAARKRIVTMNGLFVGGRLWLARLHISHSPAPRQVGGETAGAQRLPHPLCRSSGDL